MTELSKNLAFLQANTSPLLAKITRGVEKESLRVNPQGHIAQTPHPKALGATLTHPKITTDYSEALLEFITPPLASVEEVIETLEDIHSFVYQEIDDELLWGNSMPCMLGTDADIPVAQYGSSNIGKMKEVYRLGLGHRYGRFMQTIAGIHYNFSLPDDFWLAFKAEQNYSGSLQDFKTERYLGLIRNFRRHMWLLLYLFGAAPAVCKSFVKGREHSLVPLAADDHTLHTPFATSLRMGDLGYQSKAQQDLMICYNTLPTYIETLQKALTIPYPAFQAIDDLGEHQQLNANLLQIENEFYSTIRPKRNTSSGQAPLLALKSGGIEYIEVRCLDLNPFSPVGISAQQMYFLDSFLMHCLLSESPLSDEKEYQAIQRNQQLAVYRGRDPELTLYTADETKPVKPWAEQLIKEISSIASLLDEQQSTTKHQKAVSDIGQRIKHPEQTPAQVLLDTMQGNQQSYFQLAMSQAQQHRDYFKARPLSEEKQAHFKQLASESLHNQTAIEQADTEKFDDFLKTYFSQYQQL